jgi:hypothetical protein
MRAEHDAMMVVRAELCERLESLRRLSGNRSGRNIAESVHSIRRLAAAYGLTPVVRLAEAMERAAAESGRRAGPDALWLDRLHDAIGCEGDDEQASQAMIASVSVRYGA